MNKLSPKIAVICLDEFKSQIPDNGSVFNGIALIQEGLTDLGYQPMNRHHIHGDVATLAPVRQYIRDVLTYQTAGIPTNVSVTVKPANSQCYTVMFFN